MTSCRPTRISTATASVMKGNQPMASPPPSARLAVSMPPGFSRRESAEKVSSSTFWMMMESPNVTRIGGRMPRPSRRLRTQRLERVAERGHERHHQDQREERVEPERLHHDDGEERGQDAEVAVGQVDDAHDPEDERQAGGEERVEPAEQEALQDGVDPGHRQSTTPK